MKKILFITVLILAISSMIFAQQVPQGMKYQAVARNAAGEILSNRSIILRIDLKSEPSKGSIIFYSEEHVVTTNQLGLFDLVVGEGKAGKGVFKDIPWSSEDIWMGVSLKDKGSVYSSVSESRLMAVPYAFYAQTASKIVGSSTPNSSPNNDNSSGAPAQVWSLKGNSKTNSEVDKLGTTDNNDLVMVTNNIERFRITKDGDINITQNTDKFVVTIENTNDEEGDGMKIKLGRTHPAWNGSGYLNVTTPAEVFDGAISTIKGWVIDHNASNASQLVNFVPSNYTAAMACYVVNGITDRINDALHLPVVIGGWEVCFGKLGCEEVVSEYTLIPAIPKINCTALGLPSFSVPNINFVNVNNSLSNKNQFISFIDKDNRELGSIRAQSVVDWEFNYLDGTYFVNLMAGMVGIDLVNGVANAIAGFTNMAKSYNSIGVEYASGHGDYAEWLERTNPFEMISAGDIVGVKGGKVSKNLQGAEQILAVSHNPIVLGNAQSKEREPFGNKIAFTGQVPVKVVGPVNMGDYIIAKGEIQGYGIAIKPAALTTDDLKLAVGRSWETNLNEGPKMVNTLIGVDNGDYIKIMKESQDKIEAMEIRMKTMEEKMNYIFSGKGKRKVTKK